MREASGAVELGQRRGLGLVGAEVVAGGVQVAGVDAEPRRAGAAPGRGRRAGRPGARSASPGRSPGRPCSPPGGAPSPASAPAPRPSPRPPASARRPPRDGCPGGTPASGCPAARTEPARRPGPRGSCRVSRGPGWRGSRGSWSGRRRENRCGGPRRESGPPRRRRAASPPSLGRCARRPAGNRRHRPRPGRTPWRRRPTPLRVPPGSCGAAFYTPASPAVATPARRVRARARKSSSPGRGLSGLAGKGSRDRVGSRCGGAPCWEGFAQARRRRRAASPWRRSFSALARPLAIASSMSSRRLVSGCFSDS